jgi:hypothetical protein
MFHVAMIVACLTLFCSCFMYSIRTRAVKLQHHISYSLRPTIFDALPNFIEINASTSSVFRCIQFLCGMLLSYFFIWLKRGSSGHVMASVWWGLFPFFIHVCDKNRGRLWEHRDVENQEHQINKMGLQVNRAQLAVYTGCDRRTRN